MKTDSTGDSSSLIDALRTAWADRRAAMQRGYDKSAAVEHVMRAIQEPTQGHASQAGENDRIQLPRSGPFLGNWAQRSWAGVHVRWWNTTLLVGGIIGMVASGILYHVWGSASASETWTRTYRTVSGQQATVRFANGVQTQLGPATTLIVSIDPVKAKLTVSLIGQAQFIVQHTAHIPFEVRTGNAMTRVLGTTFFIRQYETDRFARIVVTEGRVAVQGMRNARTVGSAAILTERTLGVINDSGGVRVTPNIAIEEYTGWLTGQLVFNKTPVRDIVTELGRAYGADIRLADSVLAARALTWSVPVRQKSLAGVLDALTGALDAHVTRSGNVIFIVPGAAVKQRSVPMSSPSSAEPEREYGR